MSLENPIEKPAESEGSNRPSDEQSTGSQPQIPPVSGSAKIDPPKSPESNKVPRKTHRDWLDYTVFVVQAVGVVFLIAYTTFAALQWCEFKRANKIASDALMLNKKSTWLEQRAWINVSADKTVTFNDNEVIKLPLQLDNPGVTPASKLNGNIVLRIMRKGQPPDFSHPQLAYNIQTPVLVPRFHKTVPVPAINRETGELEVLTPEIHKGMTDKSGSMYMIIWGKLDYIDAWKVPHWIQFCDTIGVVSAPTCSDYNQTDVNEPQ